MILIGSEALVHSRIYLRPPKDLDFICTMPEFQKWVHVNKKQIRLCYPVNDKKYIIKYGLARLPIEFEIAWPGSAGAALIDLVVNDDSSETHRGRTSSFDVTADMVVPSVDVLFTLKMSHRYLKNSPHFLKTRDDIRFLRAYGAKIPDAYKEWFRLREKETYDYGHPNLKQSKKGFFDASVKYTYDHDTLHQAVKWYPCPAYEYYKSDKAEVFCDKKKFFDAPEEVRILGVLEEAYVLALERSQIPHPGVLTPRQSFLKALEKVSTSITSGWFREYAWENYDKVLARYSDDYVDKFRKGVETGLVKLQGEGNGY